MTNRFAVLDDDVTVEPTKTDKGQKKPRQEKVGADVKASNTTKEVGDYERSDKPQRRGRGEDRPYRGDREGYRGRGGRGGEGRGRGEYRGRGEGRGRGEYRGRGEGRGRGEYRGGRGRGGYQDRQFEDRPEGQEIEGEETALDKNTHFDPEHHGKSRHYGGNERAEYHAYDRHSGSGNRGRYAKKEGFGRGGWGNDKQIYKKKGEEDPEPIEEGDEENKEEATEEGGAPREDRRDRRDRPRRERRERRGEEDVPEPVEEEEEEDTGMTLEDYMVKKKEKTANLPKKAEARKAEAAKGKQLEHVETNKEFVLTIDNKLTDANIYNAGLVKSKDNELLGFQAPPDDVEFSERRGGRGRGGRGRGGRGGDRGGRRGGDRDYHRRDPNAPLKMGDEEFPAL